PRLSQRPALALRLRELRRRERGVRASPRRRRRAGAAGPRTSGRGRSASPSLRARVREPSAAADGLARGHARRRGFASTFDDGRKDAVSAELLRELDRERPLVKTRSARARLVGAVGPTTILAGVVWALVQPYRLTILHPHGQGF